ncbi:sugar ABC transporter ATP-binding protein [Caulobacter rhizosphaerae]|uniref:sugar ABC transporter ATP-binding protein n=1 Tax=Caulobacter rhizosphaerae TaxID=2010972 RepID=UPI0013D18344|nr:sugar ABC transporter ATP-binding protein [Caulobacter rhizosphaerae]GGL07916.1 sugar ABC transporter ATP-binding protein [Caulobacter rhizosphaerae]
MAVLRAEKISKAYNGVAALDGVDFDVHAGAVNVLIGENGAGKSTLMKILAGVEQPTAGRLLLDGEPVRFSSVREAAAAGVGIVFQELNLCPNLTVTQNIFLGRGLTTTPGVLDHAGEQARARAVLSRLAHAIDPDALVGDLRVGEQQIVEIAKALIDDARVLILDEPTSALSAAEVEVLFGVIGELKQSGVAVIYISHRLEELMRIGDHVTVLRDGRLQASRPASDASVGWIVEQMLGDKSRDQPRRSGPSAGQVVLAIEELRVPRPGGGWLVDGVTTRVRAGEVTALYGLLGSGRTELLEGLCGARPAQGSIVLAGEDISDLSLADRCARRLRFAPEDRQRDALFHNLSVGGNLGLSSLWAFARSGVIGGPRERSAIDAMMARLGVKAASAGAPIGTLSGGNQQKVVIGRCLMTAPLVLLLDEPSRGVDVGARGELFETMRGLAEQGLAVVFATSDLAEARAVADRVLVMAGGQLTADLPIDQADEAALVAASNGVGDTSSSSMELAG